jgi:predicted anti-sigma-YlaC factor YlaD
MNWMHSCKRAAQLLSQRLDEPLGAIDELKLRLHLSLCGNCRNVEKQLSGVHAAAADLFSGGADLDEETGPPRGPSSRLG